jgi:hypothetical protein
MEGLATVTATGDVVGLAHFRALPKQLLGKDAGFLDDLFVEPIEAAVIFGVVPPAGTPKALVTWLQQEINTALQTRQTCLMPVSRFARNHRTPCG